jgi:hypothetical protein
MQVKGEIKRVGTVDIICDICGKQCKNEHALIFADWGYDSHHDCETWECHLCEACFFDRLVCYVRSQGGVFRDDKGNIIEGNHADNHSVGLS